MQIINKTVQCADCGCIAFPDAVYCPKCGASYRGNKEKKEIGEIFERINCFSTQGPLEVSKSIIGTYYQLVCPHHGQVDIRTSVVIPTIKCPLCHDN